MNTFRTFPESGINRSLPKRLQHNMGIRARILGITTAVGLTLGAFSILSDSPSILTYDQEGEPNNTMLPMGLIDDLREGYKISSINKIIFYEFGGGILKADLIAEDTSKSIYIFLEKDGRYRILHSDNLESAKVEISKKSPSS